MPNDVWPSSSSGSGAAIGVGSGVAVDSLADEDRDAAFSVFFFLGFASGPFWSLTVGFLMETLGFNVAFSVLGVSYLIGMLLMLFVVDPRRVPP